MAELLRYIHQNPIGSHICNSAERYKWSSELLYRKNIKGFIRIDIVLNILDKDREAAIKRYRELMMEKVEKDYESAKVIGDEAYQIMCMSRNKNEARKRLDEILIDTGIDIEDY